VSENLEAQILAQWLGGVPDGTVPESLDPEVAETVFALRPEYAPAPSVTIEAVLASLTDGPLVDPAIGEALRGWLEAGPGTPPPDILPIGIVEAFYALRPDMAPAPRLGIDDILDSVTEGPFAPAQQTADVIELAPPMRQVAAPLPSTDQAQETARSRAHRRWWAAPSLTVAAVAATTIFFVGPMSDRASESPPSQARKFAPAAPSAAADAPQIHSVTFEDAEEVEEEKLEEADAVLERSTPSPSARPTPTKQSAGARRSGRASRGAVMPEAPPPPPGARAPKKEAEDWLQAVPEQPVEAMEGGDIFGSAGGAAVDFEGAKEKEISVGAASVTSGRKRKKSRNRAARWYQGGTDGAAGASQTDAAEPRAPSRSLAEDDMDVMSEAPPEADPVPGAVTQAPTAPPSRGEPLFHETEAQARSLFAAGDHEKALVKVEAALKLKSNSPFTKARLLRLKADILVGLGRETDAQKARAEAARMDPTR